MYGRLSFYIPHTYLSDVYESIQPVDNSGRRFVGIHRSRIIGRFIFNDAYILLQRASNDKNGRMDDELKDLSKKHEYISF